MNYFIADFDPVALDLGFFAIRWYSLAYIIGFFAGLYWFKKIHFLSPANLNKKDIDDLLFYMFLGVLIGGRLGHVLLYYPEYYLANPLDILKVWEGGMAFHGGILGVIFMVIYFCRKKGYHMLAVGDLIAASVPIGLFLGRITNFINGELWGRASDVSWAVIFPHAGDNIPRHPSQLYEAALEGVVIFIILNIMIYKFSMLAKRGIIAGTFLILYGGFRVISEFFREPEILMPYLPFNTTWGQWLSLPMIIVGCALISQQILCKKSKR